MSLFFKRRSESQHGRKSTSSPFNRLSLSEKRHSEFYRLQSPGSPTRTFSFLADGYTEDGQLSKYENLRPQSRLSTGSTLNSKLHRLSVASLPNVVEQEISQMIHGFSHGEYTSARRPSIWAGQEQPTDLFGKLKFYYDKYNLRHYVPVLLLIIYSIVGALLFYLIEHDHEQELFRKEKEMLESLRNDTLRQLQAIMSNSRKSEETKLLSSNDILLAYEKQLNKIKLPEALEWDMWGAFFYVGTVFTTIGYGNITARTTGGQALSILYAIIGIPLVLAILSQFGKALTNLASDLWVKWLDYRHKIKLSKLQQLRQLRRQNKAASKNMPNGVSKGKDHLNELEAGKLYTSMEDSTSTRHRNSSSLFDEQEDEGELESRTIPIWLALMICIGWICLCAGLFCIWETRWSYFTSLYFFFISLSTIGLGDVVPDHPHMLILMFWLVIIGLSIVSMLLSVIQIKMEEWLYHLLIKMRKEYQQALENGDPVKAEAILAKLLENEPWYKKNLASNLISENQANTLETQAERYEKTVRTTNNKNIQTEAIPPVIVDDKSEVDDTDRASFYSVEAQADFLRETQEVGTEMSHNRSDKEITPSIEVTPQPPGYKEYISQLVNSKNPPSKVDLQQLRSGYDTTDRDSVSDATSLPMDPVSHLIEHSMQADLISLHDQSMQTEIAQFQLDELALKLHAMQAATQIKPALVECGVETSLKEDPPKAKKKEKHMSSKVVQANLKPRFKDKATLTEPAKVENRSMETEICLTNNRSMETTNAGLWRGECSRSVQTAFDEEQNAELTNKPEDNASNKRRRFSLQRMQSCDGIETSIQCSLAKPDICDTGVQTEYDEDFQFNERRRSLSNISLMGDSLDIDKEKEKAAPKQDLIIQTDDSYLKIARRLDEYRTNKTQFLPVYAAPQKASNVKMADSSNLATQASTTQHAANRKSDRPPSTIFENPHETTPNGSEPAGPIGTRSRPQKAKKKPTTTNISTITNTPTTSNNEPSLKPEKSRSISPKPRKPSISKIGRQSSINLPLSVPRGKVTAFVTQHEKGIHNPGTPEGRRRSLVTIVREKE